MLILLIISCISRLVSPFFGKDTKGKNTSSTGKRNQILVISDDDDDEDVKEVKTVADQSPVSTKTSPAKNVTKVTSPDVAAEQVNPMDFFAPRNKVHQKSTTSSTVIKTTKAKNSSSQNSKSKPISVDDDEFMDDVDIDVNELEQVLSQAERKFEEKVASSPLSSERQPQITPPLNTKSSAIVISDDDEPVVLVRKKKSTPKKSVTPKKENTPKNVTSEPSPSKIPSKRSLPASMTDIKSDKKVKVSKQIQDDDYEQEDQEMRDAPKVVKTPASAAKTKPTSASSTPGSGSGSKSGYAKFMAKKAASAGPRAPGSKPVPVGAPNCLAGMSFVFTGELSSMSREDATDLVKRYGGRVVGAPSGKTSYVVVGDDPGESKLKKATSLKLKTVDEDEFFALISKTGPKDQVKSQPATSSISGVPGLSSAVKDDAPAPLCDLKPFPGTNTPSAGLKSFPGSGTDSSSFYASEKKPTSSAPRAFKDVSNRPLSDELWTDKYKPKSYDEVIGNKTLIERLASWLNAWDANHRGSSSNTSTSGKGKKASSADSSFKAALLSGPPGLGKTTSAHLVAKMEGFEAIEFNASDTRSKSALDQLIKETLHTKSLASFFTSSAAGSSSGKGMKGPMNATPIKGKVLIMDECDGMSAGDRGGSAELIQLIKKTQVPIICICNDRSSPKIRSLANHCLDLRFRRPTAHQVETRIKKIAQMEKLTVGTNAVGELVASTSGDIRQILNLLSTYRLGADSLTFDDSKALSKSSEKNVTLTPFDVISKLLGQGSFRNMSLSDKIDCYFQDFSLMPLFVQENYLKMSPAFARESNTSGRRHDYEVMKLLMEASLSISDGDLLDATQRSENSWSLLPIHGVFSTVRPCFFVHGHMGGMYNFPSWLGQNSKQGKMNRILRDLHSHMHLAISGTRPQVRLDYLPLLAQKLTLPLQQEGVEGIPDVIKMMETYYLTKEDWDSIMEMGYEGLLSSIASNVKSSLTRTYNKDVHPTPYPQNLPGTGKKRGSGSTDVKPDLEEVLDDDDVGGGSEDDEQENEDDPEVIAKMFKSGTKSKGKGKASGSGSTSRKGKGKQKA